MSDRLLELLARPPAPPMSVDTAEIVRAGRARAHRRRIVRVLSTAAAGIALLVVAALAWPSPRPEAMLPAGTPTTLPTAVDAVPLTREEVVEVPVPGDDGEVLYAHLLPDGLAGLVGSADAVVIAWEPNLPDVVIPGETVLLAADFVGRGSVPTTMKVHPTAGIGVVVTPAEIREIEVVDGATNHRAEAIEIGQGYRVFVAGLRPRPWTEDGPPMRPVR